MKPFFSIRIEYNPADSDDYSHSDGFAVRVAIARQQIADREGEESREEQNRLAQASNRDDVVSAISRSLRFIDGAFIESGDYEFMDEMLFALANRGGGLEENVLDLATFAVDGGSDEFLDSLQSILDGERKKGAREA